MKHVIGMGLVASVAPLVAQTPARTVQQDFQAAVQLQQAKNYADALAAWEALEKRVADRPRNLAIVRVRKGAALLALDRADEAVTAIRAGLSDLPVTDASLANDRYTAYYQLGEIGETSLDYASAVAAYRQAELAGIDPVSKLTALRGLIETGIFVDPAAAAVDLARAKTLMASVKMAPQSEAIFTTLNSQLLLNQGNFPAAQSEAGVAVKQLGGLTSNTDLYDVAARSNYAIAALLAGHADEARKYMAYTGAGRLQKGSFDPGISMNAPECGGEASLKPDDVAVVEFTIADDGKIASVSPVYAAGGGAVALSFARAVRDWSFKPEQVKAMPVFFRSRARVEMRCSTIFERPSISSYFAQELANWLNTQHVAAAMTVAEFSRQRETSVASWRESLSRSGATDSLAVVPALFGLATSDVVPREEANMLAKRALAILDANGAPPSARLATELLVLLSAQADSYKSRVYIRALTPALTNPAYANDSQSRAGIRLLLADAVQSSDVSRARLLLDQVADDAALAPNHPLRVGAFIRRASLEQENGRPAAARAAFEQSGLAANQCALVDSPPHLKSSNVNSSDFPKEAVLWGFEGWTQLQYDIDAEGKVRNERAIISYPPFVFTKAGQKLINGFAFEKTYRPDGGLGCGGSTQRVRFVLPG